MSDLAFREAGGRDAPVALLLHGFPNSSYLWKDVLPAVADAGWRAVAPDFPGYGDSPLDGPGTWEHHLAALDAFVNAHGLAPVALVVHDWGGLIGLRWACDRPDAVRALVLSGTGFFADGRWHGLATAMRGAQGEQMLDTLNRTTFGAMLRASSPRVSDEALDEYWKGLADGDRKRAALALYRSGGFEKLAGYQGRLAALGVPALILWGSEDRFAPVGGAHRFAAELPDAHLVVLDGVGHFLQEDAPERVAAEIAGFLADLHTG